MKKLYARYNAGRWIVDMPCCDGAELVIGDTVCCGNVECADCDYQSWRLHQAIAVEEHKPSGTIYRPELGVPLDNAKGLLIGRIKAGLKLYKVVLPKEKEEIERLCEKRPKDAKNWPVDDNLYSNFDGAEFTEDIKELEKENKRYKVS